LHYCNVLLDQITRTQCVDTAFAARVAHSVFCESVSHVFGIWVGCGKWLNRSRCQLGCRFTRSQASWWSRSLYEKGQLMWGTYARLL